MATTKARNRIADEALAKYYAASKPGDEASTASEKFVYDLIQGLRDEEEGIDSAADAPGVVNVPDALIRKAMQSIEELNPDFAADAGAAAETLDKVAMLAKLEPALKMDAKATKDDIVRDRLDMLKFLRKVATRTASPEETSQLTAIITKLYPSLSADAEVRADQPRPGLWLEMMRHIYKGNANVWSVMVANAYIHATAAATAHCRESLEDVDMQSDYFNAAYYQTLGAFRGGDTPAEAEANSKNAKVTALVHLTAMFTCFLLTNLFTIAIVCAPDAATALADAEKKLRASFLVGDEGKAEDEAAAELEHMQHMLRVARLLQAPPSTMIPEEAEPAPAAPKFGRKLPPRRRAPAASMKPK